LKWVSVLKTCDQTSFYMLVDSHSFCLKTKVNLSLWEMDD